MSERKYITAEDAAAFQRWAAVQRRQFVAHLEPYLQHWAMSDERAKPEALAEFRAAVVIRFAADTAKIQAVLDSLLITKQGDEG